MLRKLLPVILLLLMLGGCAEKASSPARDASASFFAMDTYMSIRAYGADGDTLRDCQHLVDGEHLAVDLELHLRPLSGYLHLLQHLRVFTHVEGVVVYLAPLCR